VVFEIACVRASRELTVTKQCIPETVIALEINDGSAFVPGPFQNNLSILSYRSARLGNIRGQPRNKSNGIDLCGREPSLHFATA
jgi:hypothetical protein